MDLLVSHTFILMENKQQKEVSQVAKEEGPDETPATEAPWSDTNQNKMFQGTDRVSVLGLVFEKLAEGVVLFAR